MGNYWYAKLFQIGSAPLALGLTLRAAVAVGLPLIGFAATGHLKAGVVGGATAMLVTLSDVGTGPGSNGSRRRYAVLRAGWGDEGPVACRETAFSTRIQRSRLFTAGLR